jgi:HSP20 family protein
MVEKSHTAGTPPACWYPSMLGPLKDIKEHVAEFFAPQAEAAANGEQYDINVELPGVSLEDINIDVHDNTLTVHGEKKTEREEKGKTYFFSERTYGSFQRSFRLPANVDADKVSASFKDGVLSISIPKEGPPPEEKRRIEIKSG